MRRTMGKVRPAEPVLLFMGTLYSDAGIFNYSKEIIEKNFGDILLMSPSIKWDHSSYYKDELGWPLFRQFIFFKNLIDPGMLAQIKLKTNEIEDALSSKGKRCINIDPGYITLSKIVLASTKNYSHRIYLGKGIYAELALLYKNHQFIAMPYTYNDYKDQTYLVMFMKVRNLLKRIHGRKACNL